MDKRTGAELMALILDDPVNMREDDLDDYLKENGLDIDSLHRKIEAVIQKTSPNPIQKDGE